MCCVPPKTTPSYVFDPNAAIQSIRYLRRAAGSSVSILFSAKANACPALITRFADWIDGLAVSSTYEARLAREIMPLGHLSWSGVVIPCLSRHASELICNTVIANSLPQWEAIRHITQASLGIRANPGLTVADDLRYNPCRKHSKLGVPLDDVALAWREGDLNDISGIHFHTACCTSSWEPLFRTVKVIERQLARMMHELEWINIGGGYRWDETTDFGPLQEAVDLLTNNYGLEVFLEPGDGIVNSAGSLHASVVDLFESDGKMVAILDTTVNHLPEVFEYQYEPDVAEHVDGAPHEYILAGCSCLAGDVFGEYAFDEPLEIGSRVVFENVGAYSLVKANMFNGINLPSIYILQEDRRLELIREFTYEDYLARCGGEAHAVMPARI